MSAGNVGDEGLAPDAGTMIRIRSIYWPIVFVSLYGLAWSLTGESGARIAWPVDQTATVVYLVVMSAGVIIASAVRILADGGPKMEREAVVWSAAMICGLLAYGSQEELGELYERARGNIHPSVALSTAQGEAELHRAWDGHYRAEAQINGISVLMLVDTGASMVLLPYEVAHDLGIDRERLEYSLPVTTANGQSHVAPVTLSSIKIGPIAVFDVEAAVARPGMLKTGLLGMSFLEKIDETSFRKGRLLLRN